MDFTTDNSNASYSWVPEGYVVIIGKDDQRYVVPSFFVPFFHQIFDGYWKKEELQVFKGAGNVSTNHFL